MKVKEDDKGNITFGERKPEIEGVTVVPDDDWIAQHEKLHESLHQFYTYPTPRAYKVIDVVPKEILDKIAKDFIVNKIIEDEWKDSKAVDNSEEDVKV